MLNWRTVTSSRDPAYMIKGTVLATVLIPGHQNRFCVEEVRGYPDVFYRVRDAETISDAELRDGKFSKVVFSGDLDDCLNFCG